MITLVDWVNSPSFVDCAICVALFGTTMTPPSMSYRAVRWVAKEVSETWFREHGAIETDNIPETGGVLFAAWHPGSLIDPLLMISTLPGQITFIAKHTLFKVPILGRMMKAAGARPIYRSIDKEHIQGDRKKGNQAVIETVADILVDQGNCVIFPEGVSHLSSQPERVKTGPARMLLLAIRRAREQGVPEPVIVPIGLHYSDPNRFRERALVEVHSPMEIPPLPGESGAPSASKQMIDEFGLDEASDRAWVNYVTEDLGGELQRTSHGLETWEDRKLLWRARGLVSVHRNRLAGRSHRASFEEAVLGARRLRAAWLYMMETNPERANQLRSKVEMHSKIMQSYGLSEYELYDRNKRPGPLSMISASIQFLWCWIWMLGLITWSALLGSYPPYRFAGPIAAKSAENEPYALGTKKIAVAFMLLPIWWVLISFPVAWLLAGVSSPVWHLLGQGALGFLKPSITSIPWVLLAFILMPLWSVGARLHLRLWQRSVRAMHTLRRWFRLRDGSVPWQELSESQIELAKILDSIGKSLILPGDSDWVDPPSGEDDHVMVRTRSTS